MDKKLRETLTAHMQEGTIFEGKVKLAQYDEVMGTDILLLDLKELTAKIPRNEVDIFDNKQSLLRFIGAKINFRITDILEDGTIIGSRRSVQEDKRKALIEELENGAQEEGKITKLLKYGAYLNIKGVQVVLKNVDFASDYTTVAEKHEIGDKILVKLNKINSNNKIQVEAVEKVFTPTSVKYEDFKLQQVVYGRIRSIKPDACFVGLIPNLDALASIPDNIDFPLEEGMPVLLKITKLIEDERRVRGKIIKVFQHQSDLMDDEL